MEKPGELLKQENPDMEAEANVYGTQTHYTVHPFLAEL